MTYKELRKSHYDYNYKSCKDLGVDIGNFRESPYTFLKIRFYIEIGVILVYFLQKTNIKPNTISIIYGLSGILGGILLAIPNNYAIIAAIFIFFNKSILDATDGCLARVTNQTSFTGGILDGYGAHLNALGFQIGLGFYVADKSGLMAFYYLIPLIPFFYATRLTEFTRHSYYLDENNIIKELSLPKSLKSETSTNEEYRHNKLDKFRKYYKLIWRYLDDRARTVDLICLLILLEICTPLFLTWIVFLLFVIKQFIIFAAEFYVVSRGGWAENKLQGKIAKLFAEAQLEK